jgi:hypothetical protein
LKENDDDMMIDGVDVNIMLICAPTLFHLPGTADDTKVKLQFVNENLSLKLN